MKPWLFISDLHLSPERPEIIALFERFIQDVALQAERLYILGDFLEYWIGDDDKADGLEPVFDALKTLHDSGVDIFFMAGNRDFLVGEKLAERCGFKIIDDPCLVEFNNTPILLMHGDSMCTDDIEYQQFRGMVRNPAWQSDFLAKPIQEREAIARSIRNTSKQANAVKDEVIMDVNPDQVENLMRSKRVKYLIHGHTHRPAIHSLTVDDQPVSRVVLSDWYETGGYLLLSDLNNIKLSNFH